MNPITRMFAEEWVHALAWTLLHSLWQGLLLALLLALAFTLMRHQRPQARYLMALGALGSLVACAVLTFFMLSGSETAEVVFGDNIFETGMYAGRPNIVGYENPVAQGQNGWLPSFFGAAGQWLPMLVLFWLLGVAVLTMRSLGEMLFLQHLRFQRSRPVAGRWQDKLDDIAESLGLPATVELRQSLRINTPMVIGFIRPVILLPAGLLTQLPPSEVEMILTHELAHIRRHDYLVNLLQTLAEILLFFNPAVWWISSLIRAEREHCCDDAAIALQQDERAYVRTLGRLEEFRQENLILAMGLLGPRGSVLGRMQRMMHGDQPTRVPFRLFWALIFIIGCSSLLALRPAPEFPQEEESAYWDKLDPEEFQRAIDTVPPRERRARELLVERMSERQQERREIERELREAEFEMREMEHEFSADEREWRRDVEEMELDKQIALQEETRRVRLMQRQLEKLQAEMDMNLLAQEQEMEQSPADRDKIKSLREEGIDLRRTHVELQNEIGDLEFQLEEKQLEWSREMRVKQRELQEVMIERQDNLAEHQMNMRELQQLLQQLEEQ